MSKSIPQKNLSCPQIGTDRVIRLTKITYGVFINCKCQVCKRAFEGGVKFSFFALNQAITKTLILMALWWSNTPPSHAQNLVPNGDFETVLNCPAALGNIENDCSDWYGSIQPGDPSVMVPSPDWYHTCGTNGGMVPPSLTLGYQEPLSGEGMAAIIAYAEIGETY